MILCLLHGGMGFAQSTFPAIALEQWGQGQVLIFLITHVSQWHPVSLIWNPGSKTWGKDGENMLRLTWGIPFRTHQWQLPDSLFSLPESAILGERGRGGVTPVLVPKTSFNTGDNQSSYHCCLFKPNDFMLCWWLVLIRLPSELCGEITFKCSFILSRPAPPPHVPILYVWC